MSADTRDGALRALLSDCRELAAKHATDETAEGWTGIDLVRRIDAALAAPVEAAPPVESDEQCIRCLDYRTHCDCPPAPPAGAVEDAVRRERIRQMNYSLWMQDSENGMEPPPEWQAGYRAALATPAARQGGEDGYSADDVAAMILMYCRSRGFAAETEDARDAARHMLAGATLHIDTALESQTWTALSARPAAGDGEAVGALMKLGERKQLIHGTTPEQVERFQKGNGPGWEFVGFVYTAPPAREGVPEEDSK